MALSAMMKAFIQHRLVIEWDLPAAHGAMVKGTLMSDEKFAEFIGVHPNTLKLWKKNAEWKAAYKKARERLENSHDYFLECMKYRADEELWVNYNKATGADKRQYLKMIIDRTEKLDTGREGQDYTQLTDDELLDLCIKRDIAPVGLSVEELRTLANQRKGA